MAQWTVLRRGIGLILGTVLAVFLLSWNVVQAGIPVPSKNAVTPAEMQRGGLPFRTDKAGAFVPAPDLATEAHMRINAKAARVQVLLEDAWERTRKGEAKVRPWPWADTWPVARLRVPRLDVSVIVEIP